jgi:DNA polymerase III delta prime subunit
MDINDTNKTLHHANIVVGVGNCKHFVFEILEKNLNFNVTANPDFLFLEKELLGIDDVRDLERWAIGKSLINEVKVSLMIIKSITPEAQNALLKVLEEPTLGTYIFISLENLGGILPTFLSRVRVLNLPKNDLKNNPNSKNFLSSNIKEKLAIIKSLSKKEDKNDMKELIKNLEEIAYKNNYKPQDMKNILTAKIFASARGSSPKMLLEWLSCVL